MEGEIIPFPEQNKPGDEPPEPEPRHFADFLDEFPPTGQLPGPEDEHLASLLKELNEKLTPDEHGEEV